MESAEALPTRREKRKQEIRHRILDAAYTLFRDLGIESTSIEQVCTAADVARRTFYGYYTNKQDLLRDLSHNRSVRAADELVSNIMERYSSTSERLAAIIDGLETNLSRYHEIDRHLMLISPGPEDERNPLREVSDSLQDRFCEILRAGQVLGDTTSEFSPEILAEMVVGTTNSLMVHWAIDTSFPLFEKLREARLLFNQVICVSQQSPFKV
ncbi:MAG: AcrR family transcriptional regulator [Halieaceae bacterium]|jgi:AcrR family transcriptional regulator